MEGDRSEASASLGASKATRQSASSRKEDVKERAQRWYVTETFWLIFWLDHRCVPPVSTTR
jgi:hypothetical protein